MTSHNAPGINNLTGILYMVAAIFTMSTMDAAAKWLVHADYSVFQILFVRSLMNVVVLLALVPFMGGLRLIKTNRVFAHGVRGVLGFVVPFCFFSALRSMGLAEATVVFFISPFVMTALSVPFFKEKVGVHRWGAIFVGFCGVLYVVQPTSEVFDPAAFLVLGGSLAYCFLMLSSRWLGSTEATFTIVFYVNFVVMLCGAIGSVFYWVPMPVADVGVAAIVAFLSLIGNFFIIKAFTIGEVGVITPFEYTALIWAVLLGVVLFDEIPTSNVWVGSAGIAASGLYMVYRENRKKPAV
jgi:drug/metabolite transporter (DMT)-like permease